MMRKPLLSILLSLFAVVAHAQVGDYRSDLSVGVNGGYVLSNVGFTPKVNQTYHTGITGGLSLRYVCEKYFNTICAVAAEVNYAQLGWKEDILDIHDQPVINGITGLPEQYTRTLNYFQVPVFAHLAWGKEDKGFCGFINLGPQLGLYMSDATDTNFDVNSRNAADRINNVVAQDTMAVENRLDYGIAVGVGMEYSVPYLGHFLLEARYYYGLGNIFGDTKRDYFGKSNLSNILVKMTYLFDITRSKRYKKE